MRKQTTVGSSEIFNFAKEAPFNLAWNDCNDIFFREEILTYKGTNELDRGQLKYDLKYPSSEKEILAKKILIAFMEFHKLRKMLVLND